MSETYETSSLQTAGSLVGQGDRLRFPTQELKANAAALKGEVPVRSVWPTIDSAQGLDTERARVFESSQWTTSAAFRILPTPVHGRSGFNIRIQQDAQELMTDLNKKALDILLRFIELESDSQFVLVKEILISGYIDPEDRDYEIVILTRVSVDSSEALRFWDKLGRRATALAEGLSPQLANTIARVIAIEVAWEDEPTIQPS